MKDASSPALSTAPTVNRFGASIAAGIASANVESEFALPAAATNRMSGALANAFASAFFCRSKYLRAIDLRSSGVLPMPHSSRSSSMPFTLPPQLMLTTRTLFFFMKST